MGQDWYPVQKNNSATVNKERRKARELRKSQWWKNCIQKGVCYYCQKEFPPKELTMDHIVPISRGGKSNKGNVVPACPSCNANKKLHTPADMVLKELQEKEETEEEEASSKKPMK